MTRGSEYRILRQSRQFRAVRAEEGQALFGRYLAQPSLAGSTVLISELERKAYQIATTAEVQPQPPQPADAPAVTQNGRLTVVPPMNRPMTLDLRTHGYLEHHLVNGQPTQPAAATFAAIFRILADAIHGYRPARLTECEFRHLIKVRRSKPQRLNLRVEPAIQGESLSCRLSLEGDVIHPSGTVLEKGRQFFTGRIDFRAVDAVPDDAEMMRAMTRRSWRDAVRVDDPYIDAPAPICLGSSFACLSDLRIDGEDRRAGFAPSDEARARFQSVGLGALLLDAMFRVGGIMPPGAYLVYPYFIPIQFGEVRVYAPFASVESAGPVTIVALGATTKGNRLFFERIVALAKDRSFVAELRKGRGVALVEQPEGKGALATI